MKTLFLIFLLLTFSLISHKALAQGFPYHEYKTRTMAELVEMDADVSQTEYKGAQQIMIHANPFYSAIRVKYTGKSRPLSKEKINLFNIWQETFQVNKKVLSLLESEYLFKECDKEYWIPIQKPV